MAFVPEGQVDCSQARSAWAAQGLPRVYPVARRLEACAPKPKGLYDSAQGFNPGKPQNKRFALKLKGRETIGESVNLAPSYFNVASTFDHCTNGI
jgi:hypothetical protein